MSHLHQTDRSRYLEGLQRCLRKRWLEYDSGPHGMGIRRKAHALPLVTGTYVHEATAEILQAFQREREIGQPLNTIIRSAVEGATDRYQKTLAGRGFLNLSEDVDQVVEEQCALVEGLVRGAFRLVWPSLLQEWTPVLIEQECEYVFGCTCGLADGVGGRKEHEARGCTGILWMSRPDLIMEHRERKILANFQLKTARRVDKSWKTQWEGNVQLAVEAAGAEARLGRRVEEMWVLGMVKGDRKAGWDRDYGSLDQDDLPSGAPKQQQSPFCYGYFSPGTPPMVPPQWRWANEYFDDTPSRYQQNKAPGPRGYRHTLTKDYQRVPSWKQHPPLGEGETVLEWWVRNMPEEVLRKQYYLAGPYQRPARLVERFFDQAYSHEKDYANRLAVIAASPGSLEETLDAEIPPSWDCHRYYQECPFIPICHEAEASKDPIGSGLYVPRRPHHEPERELAREKGIPVPEEDWEEEEDA